MSQMWKLPVSHHHQPELWKVNELRGTAQGSFCYCVGFYYGGTIYIQKEETHTHSTTRWVCRNWLPWPLGQSQTFLISEPTHTHTQRLISLPLAVAVHFHTATQQCENRRVNQPFVCMKRSESYVVFNYPACYESATGNYPLVYCSSCAHWHTFTTNHLWYFTTADCERQGATAASVYYSWRQ